MKTRTSLLKTRILFLITLLCAAVASLQIAHAATITVMNTGDSGAGSLRQALANANDGDTINFAPAVTGTILLTSGELLVDKSITISGPGANVLAVNGNAASRVFHISPSKTVTISDLTITNGNAADSGGGILNDHATLTVDKCTLSGNSVSISGGGIYNFDFGGPAFGGDATLTVTNSTLSGNSANSGGGIFNNGVAGGNATVTVSNSTLSGNSAPIGGGIFNSGGQSGIATLTVTNSTFSDNSASFEGGGIFNTEASFSIAATVNIGDTILKAGSSGGNIFNDSGTVNSLGYNLDNDGTSGLSGATDIVGTPASPIDVKLGPLAFNGGPTQTLALLTGSPAINAGDPNFTSPPSFDQRGAPFVRVANGRIDIGAFEVQESVTIVCPQPQGYWKNNPNAWPSSALPMTLGSQTYTKAQLLTILSTPIGTGGKADASLILADQLIAAKLNIANGADGTPVTSTIADADAVLSLFIGKLPYRVRPNTTNGQRMVNDASVLDNYNNGLLTTGCTPTPTPTP